MKGLQTSSNFIIVLSACVCCGVGQTLNGISNFQDSIRQGLHIPTFLGRNPLQVLNSHLKRRRDSHKVREHRASVRQVRRLDELLGDGGVKIIKGIDTVIAAAPPSEESRRTSKQRVGNRNAREKFDIPGVIVGQNVIQVGQAPQVVKGRDVANIPGAQVVQEKSNLRKKPDIAAVIGGHDGIQIGHSPQVVGGIDAIIGGIDANPIDTSRHVPWQAGIRRWNTDTRKYEAHCGGTILSQYWILSAAHCFTTRKDVRYYKVRVGDLDNTKLEKDEQEFDVSKIYIHPSFNESVFGSYDYDLAYIRIKDNNGQVIQYNNNVERVHLPGAGITVLPQEDCYISGWGRTTTDLSDAGTNILQVAKVKVLNQAGQAECAKNYMNMLTERMLCAGHLDGTKVDACAGDSGGPLVCKISGRNILIGVTSWGTRRCAQTGFPGIYANVQNILF